MNDHDNKDGEYDEGGGVGNDNNDAVLMGMTEATSNYIKTKNLSVEKERSVDSTAQKKTNKITKFRINAFL